MGASKLLGSPFETLSVTLGAVCDVQAPCPGGSCNHYTPYRITPLKLSQAPG